MTESRYDEIPSPMDCPYRLSEDGKFGCGYRRGYIGARDHPCPDGDKFPENCPLVKINWDNYQTEEEIEDAYIESRANETRGMI